MGTTQKPATKRSKSTGMSAEERAAMKERAAELRVEEKRSKGAAKAAAEAQDCLDKIAEMPDADRVLAERVHALVTAAAPDLAPNVWYGMPAYALDDDLVCFFQPALKFKTRYAAFAFQQRAQLDEGTMWPTAFALTAIGPAEEKLITELVRKAAR